MAELKAVGIEVEVPQGAPMLCAFEPARKRNHGVSDERGQMMFDILLGIQKDLGLIKREHMSQGIRLASLEEHMRGLMTSIYGMQADIADLKVRVDRIERRLGLNEAEH